MAICKQCGEKVEQLIENTQLCAECDQKRIKGEEGRTDKQNKSILVGIIAGPLVFLFYAFLWVKPAYKLIASWKSANYVHPIDILFNLLMVAIFLLGLAGALCGVILFGSAFFRSKAQDDSRAVVNRKINERSMTKDERKAKRW